MLFMRHSTFWILSPPIPKLSGWNFEKCLSNIGLNFLKLAIIESPINKTLHFCELIARYAWFLKVSYNPAFPLCITGWSENAFHDNDKWFHLKTSTLLKRCRDNCFIIVDDVALKFVREINFLQIFIFTDNSQKNSTDPNNYAIYLIKVNKFNNMIWFAIACFVRSA